MWQKFTERARRAVFFAQEEASLLGEEFVGTEHLLLGLIREDDSVAARLLDRMGIKRETIRSAVNDSVTPGDIRTGDMQLTPRAKHVIDLSFREAVRLNDNFIGTEHLLLGLVSEAEGLAGRVLVGLGITLEVARGAVVGLRADESEKAIEPPPDLDPTLAAMRERIQDLRDQARRSRRSAGIGDTGTPEKEMSFGDLGVASPASGRTQIEVAQDAAAFARLAAIFAAKDALGYRAMAEGDQTMFLLATGTPLKLLIPPPSDSEEVYEEGYYVRVLSGEYAGYAGWIFKAAFERIGPDTSHFPPTL